MGKVKTIVNTELILLLVIALAIAEIEPSIAS
ncbi:MAG: hypothetical protein ACJAW2_000033 [Shewanella sp.]|jgi:hypothetical protein